MKYFLAVMLAFAAAKSIAGGVPPPPCEGLTLLPSQVHITYHGLSSGCSDQGGACITGETVIFGTTSTFPCPLDYIWHFPDGDVVGATTTSVFSATGPSTIKLTAVSPVSPSVTLETTLNVVPPSAIPLFRPWFAIALLFLLAFVAAARIG
jgi:hypothetical protein